MAHSVVDKETKEEIYKAYVILINAEQRAESRAESSEDEVRILRDQIEQAAYYLQEILENVVVIPDTMATRFRNMRDRAQTRASKKN